MCTECKPAPFFLVSPFLSPTCAPTQPSFSPLSSTAHSLFLSLQFRLLWLASVYAGSVPLSLNVPVLFLIAGFLDSF